MTTAGSVQRAIERAGEIPPWAVALGLHDPTVVSSLWIRRLREAWSVSQAIAGAVLGVDETTVYRWEKGRCTPQFEVMVLLMVMELRQLAAGKLDFSETMLGNFFATEGVIRDQERLAVVQALLDGLTRELQGGAGDGQSGSVDLPARGVRMELAPA